MRSPRSVWIPLVVTMAGLGIALWLRESPPSESAGTTRNPKPGATATPRPGDALHTPPNTVAEAFGQLDRKSDARQSLTDLRKKLSEVGGPEAIAFIRDFLKTGKDKDTGMAFEIASDHSLKQWPTFRTFLLDSLRAMDPVAAAEISREILASPTTADEWALALRNVGLQDGSAETNAYLKGKTVDLINHSAWQADPSVGYLNAFDVLVYTGATDTAPLLSNLIQRKDRKDLAHAAFLTLDRLTERAPADVLPRIAADKVLQQNRPEMAAQQFARADVRDPAQQEIMKTWLLDPARTGTELKAFAGIYPNDNRFISNNLLTTEHAPSGADLAAHDRAALDLLREWSADPAFAPVKDSLAIMIGRLNGFVANPGK